MTERDKLVKRGFDLVVASAAIVVLTPVFVVVALLVRLRLGSPVLFRQLRPGKHGRLFTILKFRTMTDAVGTDGKPLPDELRLTRFGQFLRSSSLDELPELLNVVSGDMSLVGPRPLIPAYLQRYTPQQARRHEVRPGITGLAQVSGRNAISWEERLALDVEYVDGWSFRRDLWILWRTVVITVRREGISSEGHVTMPEFLGSRGSTPREVVGDRSEPGPGLT